MRIQIDLERCEDHAQCLFAVPDFFSVTDDGENFARELTAEQVWTSSDVDDSRRVEFDDAVSICPARAISIVEP